MQISVDLKDSKTVLEFLETVVKALKLQPFYGVNLEVLGKTIASLDKHHFTFPLTLKLVNVRNYIENCPNGWRIFLKSLEKAKEEYEKKELEFEYSFTD